MITESESHLIPHLLGPGAADQVEESLEWWGQSLEEVFNYIGTTNNVYVEFGASDGKEFNMKYLSIHKCCDCNIPIPSQV